MKPHLPPGPALQIALAAALALAALAAAVYAGAAPLPPRTAVNDATRECARVMPGDECGDVILPPGWRYLEPDPGACPDGYAQIELHADWLHFKAPHCCTEFHSGTRGDCQDVIIHNASQQCAFVADIDQCPALPPGWAPWGKNCPEGFQWAADQTCSGPATPSAQPARTASAPAEAAPTWLPPPKATGQPPAVSTPAAARRPQLPCGSAAGAALAALALWAGRQRRR